MAGQFDMANISGVVLRVDIVVLQDSLRIEIVDESLVLEVLVDSAVFFLVDFGWTE